MVPYVRNEAPVPDRVWAEGYNIMEALDEEFSKYGPPPPNYKVETIQESDGQTNTVFVRYTDMSNPVDSSPHPFSEAGLRITPSPVVHDEYTMARQAYTGVLEVPITYKAGTQLKWRYYRTWQGALTAALAYHNVASKDTTGVVTITDLEETFDNIPQHERLARTNLRLYHPADRKTMIFNDEPSAAMVARKYGHDLVLFCPHVRADAKGNQDLYNETNRPPIYARYSTGTQEYSPPIVLGCLPRQTHTGNSIGDVMWFFIEPNREDIPTWHSQIWAKVDLESAAVDYGFPLQKLDIRALMWCLVAIHRKKVLGYPIPDAEMLCWVWQYAHYLIITRARGSIVYSSVFKYNSSAFAHYKSRYPKGEMTFEALSRLILNPHVKYDNLWIGQYAEMWDKAIDSQMRLQIARNDAEFEVFKTSLMLANPPPPF